ncbi:hypothetical protein JCM1841_002991 [Sporobolomyces salmonicolor]
MESTAASSIPVEGSAPTSKPLRDFSTPLQPPSTAPPPPPAFVSATPVTTSSSTSAHHPVATTSTAAPPPASNATSSSLAQPSLDPSQAAQPAEKLSSDKFNDPYTDAARAAKMASQWNGLLKWARSARLNAGGAGGGWDWGTGMYHVDRNSPEYYSGVERAPIDPNAPPPSSIHPTSVVISSQHADDSDDEARGGRGFHDSGRPRRSRQAMTRG